MSHKTCFSHCHVRSQAATITTISLSKHTQECMTFLRGCSTCTACNVSVSNWMTAALKACTEICVYALNWLTVALWSWQKSATNRKRSSHLAMRSPFLAMTSSHRLLSCLANPAKPRPPPARAKCGEFMKFWTDSMRVMKCDGASSKREHVNSLSSKRRM